MILVTEFFPVAEWQQDVFSVDKLEIKFRRGYAFEKHIADQDVRGELAGGGWKEMLVIVAYRDLSFVQADLAVAFDAGPV